MEDGEGVKRKEGEIQWKKKNGLKKRQGKSIKEGRQRHRDRKLRRKATCINKSAKIGR